MDYEGVFWYEFLVLIPLILLPCCIFAASIFPDKELPAIGVIFSGTMSILSVLAIFTGVLHPNSSDDGLVVQYFEASPTAKYRSSRNFVNCIRIEDEGKVIFPYGIRRKSLRWVEGYSERVRLQKIHDTILGAGNEH